ncbi:MAG: ferrous iron transport protein A [Eggerthellaceae bacterium]|nr:ferrous iron transport protein A [Eggerthellaceae bacterium]
MNEVMTMGEVKTSAAQNSIHYQNMPLTFLKVGAHAHVAKVRGKDETHHHLENLGFVAGAEINVVSEQAGNLIVEVMGTNVALDRKVASKIITC